LLVQHENLIIQYIYLSLEWDSYFIFLLVFLQCREKALLCLS
jgi:hypothetical protein